MAVNPIIEFFSRDLVPEYCQGVESSAVYIALPFFVESRHGCSNTRLPHLPLHRHAEEIILTFLKLNINIGLCRPKAVTLTGLQSYKMFEVLPIVRINKRVGLRRILSFRPLRDSFPYRLVTGIPLKQEVLNPLQSKVRTPPPHLC
jgi:hypothetical protein